MPLFRIAATVLFALALTPNAWSQSDEIKNEKVDPLAKINQSLGDLRKLPEGRVWIETKKKIVVIDGQIVLRKGPLEMFACPPQTKEHESIIQAFSSSRIVHTGLLMVGGEAGEPVAWEPKYKPATGSKVDIEIHWLDEKGKPQKARAQEWIRNVKTQKPMTENWVFAGSEFYKNPNTKKTTYMADGGEMICVSNFTTAMLDLPIQSTQSADGLIFEAFTKKIPPLRTRVRIVLKPAVPKKKKGSKPADDTKKSKTDKKTSPDK